MIRFYSKTEKYRKLKDSELRDMTPGQRMKALEQEYEKAERNRKKVARVPKALSTLTGAGLGALVGSKAGAGAAAGAITGGLLVVCLVIMLPKRKDMTQKNALEN